MSCWCHNRTVLTLQARTRKSPGLQVSETRVRKRARNIDSHALRWLALSRVAAGRSKREPVVAKSASPLEASQSVFTLGRRSSPSPARTSGGPGSSRGRNGGDDAHDRPRVYRRRPPDRSTGSLQFDALALELLHGRLNFRRGAVGLLLPVLHLLDRVRRLVRCDAQPPEALVAAASAAHACSSAKPPKIDTAPTSYVPSWRRRAATWPAESLVARRSMLASPQLEAGLSAGAAPPGPSWRRRGAAHLLERCNLAVSRPARFASGDRAAPVL